MTDEAMTEWREGLRYRILYGLACRFLEGEDQAVRTRKVPADDLLAEVLRVATVDRSDPDAMDLAREAVEDARAGRQPRSYGRSSMAEQGGTRAGVREYSRLDR